MKKESTALCHQVTTLDRAKRVDLGRSVRSFFGDLFSSPAYQPLDLDPEPVFLAEEGRPDDD